MAADEARHAERQNDPVRQERGVPVDEGEQQQGAGHDAPQQGRSPGRVAGDSGGIDPQAGIDQQHPDVPRNRHRPVEAAAGALPFVQGSLRALQHRARNDAGQGHERQTDQLTSQPPGPVPPKGMQQVIETHG